MRTLTTMLLVVLLAVAGPSAAAADQPAGRTQEKPAGQTQEKPAGQTQEKKAQQTKDKPQGGQGGAQRKRSVPET